MSRFCNCGASNFNKFRRSSKGDVHGNVPRNPHYLGWRLAAQREIGVPERAEAAQLPEVLAARAMSCTNGVRFGVRSSAFSNAVAA